jgi:hypothetical protein
MNRNDEILKVALELQERDAAVKDRDRDLEEKARAAAEVGLDPQWIARATEIVDNRVATGQMPMPVLRTGSSWRIVIALAAGLVAAGVTASLLPWKSGVNIWRFGVDGPTTWVLEKNPETNASLSSVTLPDHGLVPVMHVDQFVPGPDGSWRANIDVTDVPELSPWTELRLQIRGDLPVARVYLDNGNERWRSGPIAVRSDWSAFWVKFQAMDHQLRQDGKWQTVDWTAPTHASAISVKTGTFMNDEHATGDVMIDDIELR